jgi:hypothetical protein
LTTYLQRIVIVGVPAVAATIVLSLSAAPAGATIVCPPGVKKAPYCYNVPPVAVTGKATNVHRTRATLNGTAGPNVNNGDITTYYFQYGKTKHYNHKTAPGTIGHCPPGQTNPAYCTTPATKPVSSSIGNLDPNKVYHYRIVATNSDGTTFGNDRTFKTKAIPPIQSVSVPRKVDTHQRFAIVVRLRSGANVTIRFNGRTYHEGFVRRHVTQDVRAPGRKGLYTVTVKAVGDETETVQKQVHVVSPPRRHHHHGH